GVHGRRGFRPSDADRGAHPRTRYQTPTASSGGVGRRERGPAQRVEPRELDRREESGARRTRRLPRPPLPGLEPVAERCSRAGRPPRPPGRAPRGVPPTVRPAHDDLALPLVRVEPAAATGCRGPPRGRNHRCPRVIPLQLVLVRPSGESSKRLIATALRDP